MITFSKFLATIKTDAPIALDMDSLVREEPDEQELRKIFGELEFRTLIDRVLGKGNTSAPATGQSAAGTPDLFAGTLFAQPQASPATNTLPQQGDLFAEIADEGASAPEKRI